MKEQCSWLGEIRQIPHWEEVEKHNVHQCSHFRREASGEQAHFQPFSPKNWCYH